MCLSPIIIRNRYNFTRTLETCHGIVDIPSNGRGYIRVPCGHCDSCLQVKKDSMYLRCRNEYNYCGKRALFLTLTYDNANLPTYPYFQPPVFDFEERTDRVSVWGDNSSRPPFYYRSFVDTHLVATPVQGNVSVWDKTHVQKYLKSLNEKLLYFLGKKLKITRLHKGKITPEWREYLKNTPRPLKYLVVCERGSSDIYTSDNGRKRFGTSRPHYHILLFLQDKRISMSVLNHFAKKLWVFGIAYPLVVHSSDGKKIRNEYGAIRYVTKYITKDGDFNYPLRYVDINGQKCTKYVSPTDIIYKSHEDELRYKPFTLLSNHLGIQWFDNIDKDYFVDTLLSTGVSDLNASTGKSRNINVPSYYINKLRYQKTKLTDHAHNADTRNLMPVIYSNKDGLTSKVKMDEVWDFYSQPVFVGYEYAPTKPSNYANVPNSYHHRILVNSLHNKALFYETLLKEFQTSPTLFYEIFPHSKLNKTYLALNNSHAYNLNSIPDYALNNLDSFSHYLSPTLLLDLLNSVTDTGLFYEFIVQHLDIDNDSPYYLIYQVLTELQHARTKLKYDMSKILYKGKLFRAIVAKPELFALKPL